MRRDTITLEQVDAICARVDNLAHALLVLLPHQTLTIERTDGTGGTMYGLVITDAKAGMVSEVLPRMLRGHTTHANSIGHTKREAYDALCAMSWTLGEVLQSRVELTGMFNQTIKRLAELTPDACKLAAVLISEGREWAEAIQAARLITEDAENRAKTDWVRRHTEVLA